MLKYIKPSILLHDLHAFSRVLEAIQIIIKMAFAAGVARVWCGTNGLLSTPATSAVIRMRGGKGYEPFGGRGFDGDGVGDGTGVPGWRIAEETRKSGLTH